MRIRFLGQYVNGPIAALALAEGAFFFGALVLAALIRFRGDLGSIELSEGPLWPRAALFSSVLLLSLLAMGLYSARQRAKPTGTFVRLVAAVGVGTALTAMSLYLIPNLWIGRGVLAFAALGATAGVLLSRALFASLVGDEAFKRRVLVYGAGHRAATLSQLRRRSDRRGFVLVGFVSAAGEDRIVSGDRVLSGTSLPELCGRFGIDEVVIAMDDRRRGFPVQELLECRLAGIEVTELLSFLERETGRVRVDMLNPGWIIFGNGFKRNPLRLFSARLLDLAASTLLLILSMPVMLLTALAIKLEDGWGAPVFYRQCRVGFGGRSFQLLKFRSMRADAERDGRARWAQENDPRITRVGAVIRRTRIDELPQIINVLRGDMSFVGPRPERPEFVDELTQKIPYYGQRHCVKPGITGWAQLCYRYGASDHDALEKLQYDLYYIKNNNLLFDVAILLQTAEVVLLGEGVR